MPGIAVREPNSGSTPTALRAAAVEDFSHGQQEVLARACTKGDAFAAGSAAG